MWLRIFQLLYNKHTFYNLLNTNKCKQKALPFHAAHGVVVLLWVLCLWVDEKEAWWPQILWWMLTVHVAWLSPVARGTAHSLTYQRPPETLKLELGDMPGMFHSPLQPEALHGSHYWVWEREPISLQIEAQLQLLEGYKQQLSPSFSAFLSLCRYVS